MTRSILKRRGPAVALGCVGVTVAWLAGTPAGWLLLALGIACGYAGRAPASSSEDLDESEIRLGVESMPGFAWAARPDGTLIYLNPRIPEYTGRSAEELLVFGWARPELGVVHPDELDSVLNEWRRCVESRECYVVNLRMRRHDGVYRWFQVRSEPQFDAEGRVVRWIGLLFDVDDSRKVEEALRSTQAELARAARVATVAELSASIAHEINQPLAAVVANGEACQRWLAAERPDLANARTTVERIIRDGLSAAQIVNRIRALFRKTASAKVSLDVNDVVAEVCRLLIDDVRRTQVRLETDLAKDLPHALADRTQIQQVIANLMHNALEAMESVPDPAKLVQIRSRYETGDVVIEVCDRGCGLVDAKRIFEPFFTTKGNGMGMGLAICRSIVEAHDGNLWAIPNDGPGTTFRFTLPVNGPP